MRVVLHIGMGKTGTSSLQDELAQQGAALARGGVVYPVVDHSRNHAAINCLVQDFDRVPRQFRGQGRDDPESMREYGAWFWEEVTRAAADSGAELVVLSSEHFFYLRPEEVRRLHDLVAAAFAEVDVVAYVRSPASYYVAVSQQRVKASSAMVAPSEHRLPIRSCLERHQQAFGRDRLVVRPFERSQLVGGDIVRDFCHAVLPPGAQLERGEQPRDVNESVSAEAMCILQRFRALRFPAEDDVFNDETRMLLRELAKLRLDFPQTTPRLRPGLAAMVTRNHAEDLDWLREEFGIEFDQFDDPATADASVPDGTDLVDVLEVEQDDVDATLYALLEQLMTVSAHRRMLRSVRRAARLARTRRRVRLSRVPES